LETIVTGIETPPEVTETLASVKSTPEREKDQ
jgi:hypothetical protein